MFTHWFDLFGENEKYHEISKQCTKKFDISSEGPSSEIGLHSFPRKSKLIEYMLMF